MTSGNAPPPAPKYSQLLTIVDNSMEDELEIMDSEADMNEVFEIVVVEQDEEEDETPVFVIVEDRPIFPGGDKALQKFIADHIRYPESARKKKIEGCVYVRFIIDKLGNVIDIKLIRGVNFELDAEAIRVIKLMPKWTAGKQKGKAVQVSCTLPIKFSLK